MTGDEYQEGLDLGLPIADLVTDPVVAGSGDGLSWSWELDVETLLAAVIGPAPWSRDHAGAPRPAAAAGPPASEFSDSLMPDPAPGPDPGSPGVTSEPADHATVPAVAPDPAHDLVPPAVPATTTDAAADAAAAAAEPGLDPADADLAEYLDAVEAGRSQVMPLPVVAGRVAELVPAGPGLAGWLGASQAGALEDGALAGIAASYRRLASWAQAGELAAVAELASRSAAADDRTGTGEDGRPAKVPVDACAEVSLALTMSQAAATWWTDLAVTLRWRLTATGLALANGTIDLGRARAIADATACLDEDTARAVQDKVLPKAGDQTTAQLRAALRRAVIAADPQGADRRREEAEKQAKVMLYPDDQGTASLGGYSLPGIPATAAMARITALAKALQATGAGGGIDLLRAHVFVGLLLGTLPYIPPPADAPPDQPPSDEDGQPDDGSPDHGSPDDGSPDDGPAGGGQPGYGPAGDSQPGDQPPRCEPPDDEPADDNPLGDDRPAGDHPSGSRSGQDRASDPHPGRGAHGDPADDTDEYRKWARPPPAWPKVPAFLQPAPATMNHLIPTTGAGGLLDLRLPWATLAGLELGPGHLGRLGPITANQARHLADLATIDPNVQWRVIITNPDGQAIATTRVTRPGTHQAGLIKQVTVLIRPDELAGPPVADDVSSVLDRIQTAAQGAATRAAEKAARDALAVDECAHTDATTAYRPGGRLRDYVTARDLTCRFPCCRQPVWRCDLDHTTPFDQGGRTCSCNLGGLCRYHHQLKQHPRWRLDQAIPGIFTWTTATGRRYIAEPDSHAA